MATAKNLDSDYFFIGKRYEGANDNERYTVTVAKVCDFIKKELGLAPAQEILADGLKDYEAVLIKHCEANNVLPQKIDRILRGAKVSNFKNN